MRINLSVIATRIFLLITVSYCSACGTTLIRDQSNPGLSAATMYIYFYHGLIKNVHFRNRDTGEEYSNGMYGWAKEYFPNHRQYTYFAIGNLPPGRYEVNKLNLYFDGDTSLIDVPSAAIRFELKPGEIKYLGEYMLGYVKSGLKVESDTKYVKRVYSYSSSADMLLTCTKETESKARTESESAFLRFFVAKGRALPHWAQIAETRLKAIESGQTGLAAPSDTTGGCDG